MCCNGGIAVEKQQIEHDLQNDQFYRCASSFGMDLQFLGVDHAHTCRRVRSPERFCSPEALVSLASVARIYKEPGSVAFFWGDPVAKVYITGLRCPYMSGSRTGSLIEMRTQ